MNMTTNNAEALRARGGGVMDGEHDFDDHAVCRRCRFDSAEWYWSKTHGDEFPWPECPEPAHDRAE